MIAKDKQNYNLTDNILAGILMAVILVALAFLMATWIIPWGCYTRAGPLSSLWGCIVPGITILSSFFLAFVFPTVFFIAKRGFIPLPDRWYIIALGGALASQIAVSSTTIIATMPLPSWLSYSEVVFVPHGFLVGLGCGIVYCLLRLCVKQVRLGYWQTL